MTRHSKTLVLALAASGVALAVQAATPPKPAAGAGDAKPTTGFVGADRAFITKAAQGGLAEVELGKLAQDKAQSPEVKQFAQRMVQDHGKANEELKQLAGKKGVEAPTAMGRTHQSHVNALSRASGADFDREYMKHMLDDHKKDVAEFRKESKEAKDPALKAWAGKTLPALEEHLKLAQATHDALGKAGAPRAAAPAPAAPGK